MILNRATRIRRGPGFIPVRVPGWRVGGHIPRLIPTMVPHEGVQRSVAFATLVRDAPETANQAVAGLGVLGDNIFDTLKAKALALRDKGKLLIQKTKEQMEAQKAAAAVGATYNPYATQPQTPPKSNAMTYGLIAGGVVAAGLLFYMFKKR